MSESNVQLKHAFPANSPRSTEGGAQNKGSRVFLSYSVSGKEGMFVHDVVEQLYQDLTANGYQVWGYERDSVAGAPFREEYKQTIQKSDFFVVLCNEAARESDFVAEEIDMALNHSKAKIIPVQLDAKSPHPLLDPLQVAAIPYYDENRRNRVYLLHRLLKAMGARPSAPPGDKFTALGQVWKVYQRDPMFYPICNLDNIQLLGSEGHRMDIQTERDFTYGCVQLVVQSNWRSDSSAGFEKWYGHDRYSITLQGDGNVWIRWRGRLWVKHQNFSVSNWRQIRQKPILLQIDWSENETAVFVNTTETCRIETRIHRPLRLRLNADFSDYLVASNILWPDE